MNKVSRALWALAIFDQKYGKWLIPSYPNQVYRGAVSNPPYPKSPREEH